MMRRITSSVAASGFVALMTAFNALAAERPALPELPASERLHREFSAQALSVVGINAREGTATVREYAKELGLTFPLIPDPKGTINAAYGVIGLPTTFLIGRDGRPVALAVGPREWANTAARAIIQALLAEPTALKGTRWPAWRSGC
jgi:AhpC/TSA family